MNSIPAIHHLPAPHEAGGCSEPSFPRFAMVVRLLLAGLSIVLPVTRLLAQAERGVIEGRVQNEVTGDYLNNVRISIPATTSVTFTDSSGSYRLTNIPLGPVTLRASYTGLDQQDISVLVSLDQPTRQDFRLTSTARYGAKSEAVKLDAFTVAASREMDANALAINEQRYAANLKAVVAANAFGDVSEGNVGEFLKRLPGVYINEAAGDANNIVLRGFSGASTPVSVDGHIMPSASSSATSGSRMTNLETLSMSNVARVEVIKSPVPSMWASSLGGAVNLISKNAFERSRPELIVRGVMQFTSDDVTIGNSPSPAGMQASKMRPGYELSYIRPVTENFGFTLTSLRSEQFGTLRNTNGTWDYANGGSETAPYFRATGANDDPRTTKRWSWGAGADWRPFKGMVLSLGYQNSIYDLLTQPTRINLNTGTTPTAYGPDFTQGRAGQGSAVHAPIWASKFGATDQFKISAKYLAGDWKIDFSASLADSGNKYRDVSEGFFRGVTTRLIATPTVRFSQVRTPGTPGGIELRDAAGALIDWTKLSSYQIVSASSAHRDAANQIGSGRLDVRRNFQVGRVPAALQVGTALQQQTLDWSQLVRTWNFLGADGRAGTADDNAGLLLDTDYSGRKTYFGWPAVEQPDMRKFYDLYVQHPGYFALDEVSAYTSHATGSERITERLTAGYVQGEVKLFENRLWLVGGVRYERTADEGVGALRDRNAIYQHDASGNLVRGANNQPVLITSDALAQAKLQYIERGNHAARSYGDYYPSLNASFSIRPDLMLRLAYARTLGRPEYSFIIPNIDIAENNNAGAGQPGGTVTIRNTSLKPWSANGYDLSLEYYFNGGGVMSAGVFRKDVTNAFVSRTQVLDDDLLAQFELEPAYLGWNLVSRFNVGVPVKLTGYELNYQQQLTMLPKWASGLSVFANATFIDIDGPDGEYDVIKKTANWGLSYSRGRLGIGLAWNFVGSQQTGTATFAPDAATFSPRRIRLDGNCEFRLNRSLSLYFNGRNLTNEALGNATYSSRSPAYSRTPSAGLAGIKFSAGVRGSF